MSLTNWLSDSLGLSSRTPGRALRAASKRKALATPRSFRPYLECLESRLCLSTLIDAHALTMPVLALDSATSFSTAAVFSAELSAGTHTLLYGNGVGPHDTVAFSVDNSGAVDYDPSLNAVLSGRGSSTLLVNGVTVQIDAHALTMPGLLLNSTVNFATATPLSATLLPGLQSLLYGNGVGPHDTVAFSVDNSGAVDYDPLLNAVLSGRGSSTLLVNGVTVLIDAHALTMPGLLLNSTVNFATAAPLSATLLPGLQSLLYGNGVGPHDTVAFSVDNSGAVDYDPLLNAVLSGRGSSTLLVNGVTVLIDAHALTMPGLLLNSTVNFATAAPLSATLLPGLQSLLYGNGVGPHDTVAFSVDNSGAVDYDPSLNAVLSGRGSSTLLVNGVTVQIDAHALTMPGLLLNSTVNFATATPLSATLLPGLQSLLYGNGVGPHDTVAFSVDNSGAVDYDPLLNAVLSGRGSSTLLVNGVTVLIDAHALTMPGLLLNSTVNFATAAPLSATLLPGLQSLLPVNGGAVAFSVNNSGAVDYDPSLNTVLSGRASSTLVVNGPTTTTTTVTAANATYNGLPHGATAAVTPGSPAGTTTFLYTGTGATVYSSSAAPINAGSYHVVATFTPDDSSAYHASSGSADYTISKATLTGNATTQGSLNMAKQGKLTITVTDVSGLASGDTFATVLSTAHYYITIGTIRYEFVPTTVTTSGSSITIAYTLKNSALLEELGAALDAATSGATAVTAGFYMESMNYSFTDDYLTRVFSTVH